MADERSGIIEIKDLEFRWQLTRPPVLSIESLSINPGERVFIEGPSGSGKSSLLGLLAGMSLPQQGEVRILGQSLKAMSTSGRDHFRAQHIGYIFQMFNLIPYLSMLENVLLSCHFSVKRRELALQNSTSLEAEALRLLEHLDLNDEGLRKRPVVELSVGQQQRVAAARALMGAPELLIADEPTSALDADRRQAFVQLLFDECRETGTTLVFVSHDASLEALFDRCIRLSDINRAAGREGR